jgi:hypothetical protein
MDDRLQIGEPAWLHYTAVGVTTLVTWVNLSESQGKE